MRYARFSFAIEQFWTARSIEIIATLVLLFIPCCGATGQTTKALRPCAVMFHGFASHDEIQFQREVAKTYKLKLNARLSKWLAQEPFFRYDVPEGFRVREGIAYYLPRGADDEFMVVRFVPMPSKQAWDQYLTRTAALYGENTEVGGEGLKRTIRSRFVRYDPKHGIAATGWTKTVYDIDLGDLAEASRKLSDKHSYYSIRPSVLPKASREALFRKVQRAVAPNLQKRDGESDNAYSLRKSLGDSWLGLVDTGLSDVTEVAWWYSLPVDGNPMAGGAFIRFKKSGKLHKAVTRLSRSRDSVLLGKDSKGAILDGRLNLSLRQSDVRLLKSVTPLAGELAKLIDPMIKMQMSLGFAISDGGLGVPSAFVAQPTSGVRTIGSLKHSVNVPAFGPIQLALRVGQSEAGPESLTVLKASRDEFDVAAENPTFVVERNSERSIWLKADLDLSEWSDRFESTKNGTLVRDFERFVDIREHAYATQQYHTPAMKKRARLMGVKIDLDDGDFVSLASRVGQSGAWHAKLRVGPRSNALVARIEVGADLYLWLAARQLLAKLRSR